MSLTEQNGTTEQNKPNDLLNETKDNEEEEKNKNMIILWVTDHYGVEEN